MRRSFLLLFVTIVIAPISHLSADEDMPFKKEIEARQAFMQVSKFNLGVLAAMVRGKRDYNVAIAEEAAKNLYLAAQMQNTAMWPQGSDNSNPLLKGKTDALIEGWQQTEMLLEKQKQWLDATANLTSQAGKGLSELKGALGKVGQSCKGCHDDFKQQ